MHSRVFGHFSKRRSVAIRRSTRRLGRQLGRKQFGYRIPGPIRHELPEPPAVGHPDFGTPGHRRPDQAGGPFHGGQHAREVIGSQAAYELAQFLVEGIATTIWPFATPSIAATCGSFPTSTPTVACPSNRAIANNARRCRRIRARARTPPTTRLASIRIGIFRTFGPADLPIPTLRRIAARACSRSRRHPASVLFLHDQTKFSDLLAAIDFHSGYQTTLVAVDIADRFCRASAARGRPARVGLPGRRDEPTNRLWHPTTSLRLVPARRPTSLDQEFHTYAFTEELYTGPFYDYFTYFNPLIRPASTPPSNNAIASSMFLLSDAAFPTPEPNGLLLFIAGVAGVVALGGYGAGRASPDYSSTCRDETLPRRG